MLQTFCVPSVSTSMKMERPRRKKPAGDIAIEFQVEDFFFAPVERQR